jgi:actin-like ATPase involved in cell morphogenesis
VVVPGGDEPNEPVSDQPRGEPLEPRAEATEACRKLAERLANEIEVIVQARIETAVQEAAEDIREQVRNHLEIMLPELIEDLNALGRRR